MAFVSYPDDPPAIEVTGGPWTGMKAYFDANLACGDLAQDSIRWSWRKVSGCGARDWAVRSTFWYPRPGRQYEITCQKCKTTYGCEVRTPIEEKDAA